MKRRDFLGSAATTAFVSGVPFGVGAQTAHDSRILVVLLRGGMDGLAACPPVGDKDLSNLRDTTIPKRTLALDNMFGLHPNLMFLKKSWDKGQLAVVHATGFDYDGRSHFDGQNLMEGGGAKPYMFNTGWLGRAMEVKGLSSIAMSLPVPLVLKSHAGGSNVYPSRLPMGEELAFDSVGKAWAQDPALGKYVKYLSTGGMAESRMVFSTDANRLAAEAARQMAEPNGPRVGFVEFAGFDTHAQQGADTGEHAKYLGRLDEIIEAYAGVSQELWSKSYVVTVTEFGRTGRENGTRGTDHGYAGAVFIAGGALKKSQTIAKWPGLQSRNLFQDRDLNQTIDARAVYAAVIKSAWGLSDKAIRDVVFPGLTESALIRDL